MDFTPNDLERRPSVLQRRTQGSQIFSKNSECWKQAKDIFQKQLLTETPNLSRARIEQFFQNRDDLEGTISECESLKESIGDRYGGKTGMFLRVLQDVKDIGDPILSAAPDVVGVAWGTFSALITVATNDLQNCDLISDACVNVITIILTCRLYENKLGSHESGETGQPNDNVEVDIQVQAQLIESIKTVLVATLDFFWHANKKFKGDDDAFWDPKRKKESKPKHKKLTKIKLFFKDIFDTETKRRYGDVMDQYASLKDKASLGFQDKVMSFLRGTTAALW
ncbi:hypothetical protein ABW19_dt0207332 [Dactylella cylindrospora]|nr:hypothetical protein ABW19_dt0207332 [Dactylella cylindrospora]